MSENVATIRPIGDKVAVRPLTDEETATKSVSGIILPDTAAKEKGDQGVVVATGPGALKEDGTRNDMEVNVGDRVIFKSWSEKVKVGDAEYWIIAESDILAVVN